MREWCNGAMEQWPCSFSISIANTGSTTFLALRVGRTIASSARARAFGLFPARTLKTRSIAGNASQQDLMENRAMRIHRSITKDRIIEAVERQMISLDNPGFCVACGEDAEGCEPDARNYECECCGKRMVFGAQELLYM